MLNEFKDNTIQKIQQTSSYHSWNSLQVREKQLLKVMAFFLVLAIFYLFFWLPIATNNQQAIKKMHNAEATWQWLNKQQQKTSKTVKNKIKKHTDTRITKKQRVLLMPIVKALLKSKSYNTPPRPQAKEVLHG